MSDKLVSLVHKQRGIPAGKVILIVFMRPRSAEPAVPKPSRNGEIIKVEVEREVWL